MVAFAGVDLGVIHLNFRKANCKISQLLYMYESMVVQSYDTSAICLSDEVFGWLQAVVDDELSSSILVAFAIIMFSLMVFTFLVPVLYRPLSIFEYFLNYQRLPKQETEVAYLSPSKSEENACNCSTVALARIESEDSESALGSNGIMTANLQAVEEIVKVREDAYQPLKEDFEKSFEDDALGHLVVEKQEDRIQLSMQEYPNFSLWDAIQGLDFWVLSFLMMTGPGSGLAVINNLSQSLELHGPRYSWIWFRCDAKKRNPKACLSCCCLFELNGWLSTPCNRIYRDPVCWICTSGTCIWGFLEPLSMYHI
jgi:hypothetical protein